VRAFDLVADQRDDVRLVIAGGDGWGTEDLARAMASSRHGDLINRIGYVDPPTRDRLLAEAAVLAFPSVYEGFGLPVLEAMAAGVPVVATAAGAVPEVVGEAAVIVPVGDEEGLASALTSVLDDVALAARLRVRGRHRAATFTWERCADGLLALYEAAACE
jgi:alpha-1,3-rhamnosyl/mannosyltransferase